MSTFPTPFLWGAATAGHQVEGGNVNADCWVLEHVPNSAFPEPSHDAADHYHRFAEDIALLARLGMNAYRFSLEWSRIEPAPGVFSVAALDHYRRMAATCRDHGVATVVTFNHWTTPIWFAAEDGWLHEDAVGRFCRYVERAAAHLGDVIDWACTLNEPNVRDVAEAGGGVAMSTRGPATEEASALHPRPGRRFVPMMMWPGDQVAVYGEAHRRAREIIRAGPGDALVGWTLAVEDYQAVDGGDVELAAIRARNLDPWFDISRDDDFVGVQNYTRRLVGPDGFLDPQSGVPVNDLGWELYPQSLANGVRDAHRSTGVAVLVTEHGVATADDTVRLTHTRASIEELAAVFDEGIDLRGYLHWTLLDEFEWWAGYSTTFGLVAVDEQTFERTARPSAEWLGRVGRANGVVD